MNRAVYELTLCPDNGGYWHCFARSAFGGWGEGVALTIEEAVQLALGQAQNVPAHRLD